MSNTTLILGPIVFQDFEIPEKVNFGGGQILAIHRLPDGGRVIDAMGRNDTEIGFSGIFSGSDAALRARAVDGLRVIGSALPLIWDVFHYTVVIKDFHADYRSGHWIPFRVTCTVLRDDAAAVFTAPIGILASVLEDLAIAAGSAPAFAAALAPGQQLLAQVGVDTRGSDAHTAASIALSRARTDIALLSMRDDAGLDAIVLDTPAALQVATEAARRVAENAMALAYAGRAIANLANAET